ncbi:hypothetical protein [Litchfieldella xinjiangensis]|uniref:RipA family octameric membrane protein n=1 Tax=Litchfieldella xinjiangensis TaxID=1166948 RepID=UPI0009DCA7ED|nr:hypothetical protein [Halomonas xinjiangensis]
MSIFKKDITTTRITPEQYLEYFKGKERKALERAQDIRKFEIDLYWRRATYFWTFIGATFAGFLAIQASGVQGRQDLSVILSCLGVVFSFGWLCVNRGSKFWQENWEKHVDILEDEVTGPLYKVILSRNLDDYSRSEKVRDLITGPSALSVSKINQLISLYVFVLWLLLLWYSLPTFTFSAQVNWFYCGLIGLTATVCASFVLNIGRTYCGGCWHNAELRESRIKPANSQKHSTPKKA